MKRFEPPRPVLPPGALVRSLKGRDRGRTFLVLEDRGERVLIVDGDIHPLARPKRKNPKHVALLAMPPPELAERFRRQILRDEELRTVLLQWYGEGGGSGDGQGGHD